MKVIAIAIAVLLAFASFALRAQDRDSNSSLVDRVLRHDTPEGPRIRAAAVEQPNWEFDFGVAYSNLQGPGSSWEIPLALAYSINDENTLSVSTGALWNNDGTSTHSGADDWTVRYQFVRKFDSDVSASLVAAVIVPAGGNVGSTTATQLLQGGISYPLASSRWVLGGSIALVHVDELPHELESTGRIYAVNAKYKVDADRTVLLKIKRKERDGAAGSTIGELVYDFTFSKAMPLAGELVIDHGFTEGSRDSSIELDAAYTW
jgi:hypothetical protein